MSKSISKEIKKTGKVTFDGPNVKDRKKFAPATKVESPKKGKGSYNRRKGEEDEQDMGPVPPQNPEHDSPKKKKLKATGRPSKRKVTFSEYEDDGNPNTVPLRRSEADRKNQRKPLGGMRLNFENKSIVKFIDSLLTKNYAAADKYIKQAVEYKFQDKIKQELSTPLF